MMKIEKTKGPERNKSASPLALQHRSVTKHTQTPNSVEVFEFWVDLLHKAHLARQVPLALPEASHVRLKHREKDAQRK